MNKDGSNRIKGLLKPEHLAKPLKNEAQELASIFIASRKTIKVKN